MHQDNIAVQLGIFGHVQGVGYRVSMQARARSLRLTGWVRNQPDGHVFALVQGPRADVDSIVAWCKRGPPASRVDSVRCEPRAVNAELSEFLCLPTIC